MKKYLAIDIGGSAIKYGIVSDVGEILYNGSIEHEFENIGELKEGLIKIFTKLKEEYEISAVAISSPGSVDSKTKIIHGASALPFIHENNWVNEFEKAIGLKVSIENDANCSALCESWIGNAKGYKNIVNVVIGTGIGGSIIIEGNLVKGKNLYGGEFGFQIANSNDIHKNISMQISTRALVDRVSKYVDVQNGLEVFKCVKEGNVKVIKEVEDYYKDLAVFFFNLMHVFDPDIILVGGAISKREELIPKIEKYYNEILENSISDLNLSINKCKFNNESNLLGAVYNAKKENNEI